MIRCNLAILLTERNLKITQVAKETNISRTTLTSLCNNHCQGIQMNTLNKLCTYLQITPKEFFTYIPFEIETEFEFNNFNDDFTLYLTFKTKSKSISTLLLGSVEWDEKTPNINIFLNVILDEEADKEEINETKSIIKHFKKLPIQIKKEIENKIKKTVIKNLFNDKESNYIIYLSLPEEFE